MVSYSCPSNTACRVCSQNPVKMHSHTILLVLPLGNSWVTPVMEICSPNPCQLQTERCGFEDRHFLHSELTAIQTGFAEGRGLRFRICCVNLGFLEARVPRAEEAPPPPLTGPKQRNQCPGTTNSSDLAQASVTQLTLRVCPFLLLSPS